MLAEATMILPPHVSVDVLRLGPRNRGGGGEGAALLAGCRP